MISLCHNDYCCLMVDVVSTRTPRFFPIFHPVSSQQVLVLGLFYCRYKTLHFPLAELQEVPVSPFLQSVKIPLVYQPLPSVLSDQQACWGYTPSHHPDHIQQDCSQYYPLGYTASYWPPRWLCSTDLHPLALPLQAVLNPSDWLLIQPVGDSLIEVQVSKTACSPLIYQASHFIEGHHVIQAIPPVCESMFGLAYVLSFAVLHALLWQGILIITSF